jgi:hypothetical protein
MMTLHVVEVAQRLHISIYFLKYTQVIKARGTNSIANVHWPQGCRGAQGCKGACMHLLSVSSGVCLAGCVCLAWGVCARVSSSLPPQD